jgi:hypothetical protein
MSDTDKMKGVVLPDWLGSGQDLFGTIQIMKGKQITRGFLELDFDFKFSETFNYPIVFEIKNLGADIEAFGIAFRIDREADPAQRFIEENIIAPKVCNSLRKIDFVNFFAEVIDKNVDFALYLDKTPRRFEGIRFIKLNSEQILVFDEKMMFAISEALDRKKNV